jgi:hypothetical protein
MHFEGWVFPGIPAKDRLAAFDAADSGQGFSGREATDSDEQKT